MFKKLSILLEMIKFQHTIFALPFALAAAVVAARGLPAWPVLGWILLAMVGARTAAMAFNRLTDRDIDAKNPRTQNRALPAGSVKIAEAWALVLAAITLFELAAYKLNTLAFALSPLALIVILGYSFTKRFTSLSHLVLGLSLGIAPVGAWIAVTGEIGLPALILCGAVLLWTAGFDLLYALQDIDFDKDAKLFSLPKVLGVAPTLWLSRLMHLVVIALLAWFGKASGLHALYFIGIGLIAVSLTYEQSLLHPNDLRKLNVAFFTMNGLVSVLFFLFTLADLWLPF